MRTVILQKRFIEAHTWGRDTGCSPDFIGADHFSQWLADQTKFILSQLACMRPGELPDRIVIAGVSEGGEVVPALARSIPGVDHAVIIGNGGMNPLNAYRLLLAEHPSSRAVQARAALQSLAQRPADPDTIIAALGSRTWRYWSELAILRHTDNLLALQMPVWVAIGAGDAALPVVPAWSIVKQQSGYRKHAGTARQDRSNDLVCNVRSCRVGRAAPRSAPRG